MPIDRETVRHVALLSRIDLSDEELDTFTRQLSAIVQYVDQLKEVDTTGIAPMQHTPREDGNIVRDDAARPSLDPSKALEQAPEQAAGHFRVPRVVE